jgi:3-oxoacyl-[acyl-carrier-protein] synthase II
MLCGGADEYHPLVTGTFDIMSAASSSFNDRPAMTPRPFDSLRDGVVCGEGAGILLLETYDSAVARGAAVFAEIAGFASSCDADNIASPSADSLVACLRAAMDDADARPDDVGYINAHATGTELGDIAESQAIAKIFGINVPVSSIKGHIGHTMAASGALETIASVCMICEKTILPTLNLDKPDPRCSGIFLNQNRIDFKGRFAVKNSFALGGTNCALILGSME